ncbi:MAG: rRNA maturation RNase YbeY [Flavobacteriaceae bacterium]
MILFNYENDFSLAQEEAVSNWIIEALEAEGFDYEDINFIFCNDEYLLKLNKKYLNHDTFTDIISFDYSIGNVVSGDIFISTERVSDNANKYQVSFENELHRVIIHGILHFMGYNDKSEDETLLMREKENQAIKELKF